MNICHLHSEANDSAFLAGDQVIIHVAVSLGESPSLSSGNAIVIRLSKGKKYMGMIVGAELHRTPAGFEGILFVRKK